METKLPAASKQSKTCSMLNVACQFFFRKYVGSNVDQHLRARGTLPWQEKRWCNTRNGSTGIQI